MRKISKEEFEKRIKARFPNESFTVIKYESLGKESIIKCNQCEKKIIVSVANNFLAKNKAYGCVQCHGLRIKREEKLNQILELYDIIGQHLHNTHTYYTIKCKKCGHERTSSLNNLYRYLQCGCETNVKRRTKTEFLQEVYNKYGDDFIVLDEYKNMATKIAIKHKCGFIWKVRPSDFLYGEKKYSCPKCLSVRRGNSQAVLFIERCLQQYNIPFEREHLLENSKQRFDFYIETPQQEKIAIEYNGAQHYFYNEFFHKDNEGFKKVQERDRRKAQYCLDNNITLIVIPYNKTYEEIKEILNSTINKFNDYPVEEYPQVSGNSTHLN